MRHKNKFVIHTPELKRKKNNDKYQAIYATDYSISNKKLWKLQKIKTVSVFLSKHRSEAGNSLSTS
jgi:hypothetical protein